MNVSPKNKGKKIAKQINKCLSTPAPLIAPPVAATFVVAPPVVDPVHKEPSSAAMKTALLSKTNPEYDENEKRRKQI